MEAAEQVRKFEEFSEVLIPLNVLRRSKYANKTVKTDGFVKDEKRGIKKISSKFDCPSCGNIINIDQTDEKYKEPASCGCGRKGKFRFISDSHADYIEFMLVDDLLNETTSICVSLLNYNDDDINTIINGNKVEVTGILKDKIITLKKGGKSVFPEFEIDAKKINQIGI